MTPKSRYPHTHSLFSTQVNCSFSLLSFQELWAGNSLTYPVISLSVSSLASKVHLFFNNCIPPVLFREKGLRLNLAIVHFRTTCQKETKRRYMYTHTYMTQLKHKAQKLQQLWKPASPHSHLNVCSTKTHRNLQDISFH